MREVCQKWLSKRKRQKLWRLRLFPTYLVASDEFLCNPTQISGQISTGNQGSDIVGTGTELTTLQGKQQFCEHSGALGKVVSAWQYFLIYLL